MISLTKSNVTCTFVLAVINGLKKIWNQLSNFILIKGLGADHLILSYVSDLKK